MAEIQGQKEVQQAQGFDLMVTHRDPKTGLIVAKDPYTLVVGSAAEGGKTQLFERPSGSGNVWNKRGQAIGRFIKDEKTGKRKYDEKAAHIEFKPPETEDQKLARSLFEKDDRIAQLEKELAGIKAEKDKRQGKGA